MYNVYVLGGVNVKHGTMSLGEAEAKAKSLSARNADRYFAYAVEATSGPDKGSIVSVWVRGIKCESEQYPRVEVRQRSGLVAAVPVADSDVTWSLNAAGIIRLRSGDAAVKLVVNEA